MTGRRDRHGVATTPLRRSRAATTAPAWRCCAVALAAALAARTEAASAQGMPPWVAPGRVRPTEEARSVLVQRRDEPIYTAPDTKAPRRGAAAAGATLPLYGAEPGPGCREDFFLVGPLAWICGEGVAISGEVAPVAASEAVAQPDGLPRDYFFVGPDGAFGYRTLETAGETAPSAELQPGFAVSVTEVKRGPRAESYVRTTKGLWLPLAALGKVRALPFHGVDVQGGHLDTGWVVDEGVPVFDRPGGHKLPGVHRTKFEAVTPLEATEAGGRRWLRVAEGAWLDAAAVRVPVLSDPPAEARAGERWLDVDLERQVVVAYEGRTPVFATLVSTGTGRGDEPTATPVGVHRAWVKLRSTDMTNLEDAEASQYYAIQDVPWVLFFKKGVGFHGAFWHRSFGHVRSHGCVNLTPLDAERIFRWASPRMPAGWTAVLPTEYDPGILVRVR